jgi:hypothetical protein
VPTSLKSIDLIAPGKPKQFSKDDRVLLPSDLWIKYIDFVGKRTQETDRAFLKNPEEAKFLITNRELE